MSIVLNANDHTIKFERGDGRISILDCGGEKVTFKGVIPADECAIEFIEKLDAAYLKKIQAEKEKLKKQIVQFLVDKGITRTNEADGFWETSTGVKFGGSLLETIKKM